MAKSPTEALANKLDKALDMGRRVRQVKRQLDNLCEKIEEMAIDVKMDATPDKNLTAEEEKLLDKFCKASTVKKEEKRPANDEPLLLPRNVRRKLSL